MFALGTLQHGIKTKKRSKTTTTIYQSSCYKVKVITHTIVQTEYNNILRTPNSHTHTHTHTKNLINEYECHTIKRSIEPPRHPSLSRTSHTPARWDHGHGNMEKRNY